MTDTLKQLQFVWQGPGFYEICYENGGGVQTSFETYGELHSYLSHCINVVYVRFCCPFFAEIEYDKR